MAKTLHVLDWIVLRFKTTRGPEIRRKRWNWILNTSNTSTTYISSHAWLSAFVFDLNIFPYERQAHEAVFLDTRSQDSRRALPCSHYEL